MSAAGAPEPQRRSAAVVAFLRALALRVRQAGVGRTASSLAFTTLIGLVPIFTVAFSYVAQFPLFQRWLDALEPVLLRFFLPGRGSVVREHLGTFMQNAAGLTGINVAVVVLTSMLLIAQIDREINSIWGLTQKRSLTRRGIIYIASVTAAPVLIGAAIYFSSALLEQSVGLVPLASQASFARPVALGTGVLVLVALYALTPARRVRLRHAFAGAIAAAVAFECCRFGFLLYIRHVPTYRLVYGALSVLPLFLIWMYLSWIIVLVGAAITATLAERDGPLDAGAVHRR